MKTRYLVRLSLFILASVTLGAARVAAESGSGQERTVYYTEESKVANTIIARGAAGTLPPTLSSRDATLTDVMRLALYGTGDEVVLYDIDPIAGHPVDYEITIDFLQRTVPGACADVNPIHGSPSSYPVGTSNFPIVPAAGGPGGFNAPPGDIFWHQWAFGQIGFQPSMGAGGANTLVALLDAFPDAPGGDIPGVAFVHIDDLNAPSVGFDPTLPYLAEHGLFVTSLAAALATDATYVGVEVLNDNAIGSLHTLIAGLDWILTHFPAFGKEHLVINMSLGTDRLDRCAIVVDLLSAGETSYDVLYVAAAGNGTEDPDVPLPPLYPARLPNVLAVGASNVTGWSTAYSQKGDLLAPGGEAAAGADVCDDPATCMTGYYVVEPNGSGQASLSSGTSFASPLVAGTAASLFTQPNMKADNVRECLLTGSTANNGILNFAYCP
jgi:hypothetical protein